MSKKELAEKLGFDFEEVKDIFSEDALKSMQQTKIKGQDGVDTLCNPFNGDCLCTPQDALCFPPPVFPSGCFVQESC